MFGKHLERIPRSILGTLIYSQSFGRLSDVSQPSDGSFDLSKRDLACYYKLLYDTIVVELQMLYS